MWVGPWTVTLVGFHNCVAEGVPEMGGGKGAVTAAPDAVCLSTHMDSQDVQLGCQWAGEGGAFATAALHPAQH